MRSKNSGGRQMAAIAAVVLFALLGCGGGGNGEKLTIQNAGSDTMVNLAQHWAEVYAKIDTTVSVEVSGGGSGTGIAALINGTVDLANSSRKIHADESERARSNTGSVPVEYIVGYDALAVYVHKDNPLEEITLEQLAEIYGTGGTITAWSQLGVNNAGCAKDEIIRVSRQSNSGTYEYFREAISHAKGQSLDFKLGSVDMNGSKDVVELVAKTPCAIGYSGMGYATPQVKMLRVTRKAGEPAYAPTVATTQDQTYPIARPLYMYAPGSPRPHVQRFLDWIHSEAGQKLVEESGYVPIPHTAASENAGNP
ncbi:phosphate ABC transporter substrate-binding protein [candidate division KSB1 bacterium]|nr:phosphate ABC transporter substrate-binding protein [bacterium]NUM64240.1 phosphate ABC transporter substrate-binding protein [candidate division KSB1 bacterium]